MPAVVQNAIQAIMQAATVPHHEHHIHKPKPLVCISRDYGAGGDDLGRVLAGRLNVGYYDSAILDKIAHRAHSDPQVLKALDEGVRKARDMWLYSFVTGQDLSRDTYKRHLVNVVLSLGRIGGVIVGRGAHIILSGSPALRVRITGSEDVCAARIAAAEGLSLEAARRKVTEINAERGKFIWDTFHIRQNNPHCFDLTINTDHMDPARLTDLVMMGYESLKHHHAPQDQQQHTSAG